MKNNTNSPKKVLVTGGAQGIGLVIASELKLAGYKVVVIDNDEEAINEVSLDHKDIQFFTCDIANETAINDIFRKVDFNSLYALINNAAIVINKPLQELKTEEWRRVIDVNLTAPFLLVKAAAEYLKKNTGAVVNIASTRALMSEKDTEAYSASKGGLLSLTHALAMSLAPEVRVNAISPGWIETRDLKKKSSRSEVSHSVTDKQQHPSGRVGMPSDVAAMVEYLISEKSKFINGQNFIIDGGITKKMIYI
jgi:NAD(P)-dependent dehydrogenase (short-subunit alcohol dehydrogenase family)